MIDGKLLYPIGSIYMNIQDTNPSVFFGGTWERIAKGKTLVGVDESDSDFNISSKTGGEKTHKLTVKEIPSHNHTTTPTLYKIDSNYTGGNNGFIGYANYSGAGEVENNNIGGDQPHNNLQPSPPLTDLHKLRL